MNSRIELWRGDITTLQVDAIVNAANNSLLGGLGVEGAIHRAAGPQLLTECRTMNGCATGDAKITGGYNLPADWVIHTVGPVWHGGTHHEAQLLASAYRRSLEIATQHKLNTIAFPAISTGAYGYPAEAAAEIAFTTVTAYLAEHPSPHKVIMVSFNRETEALYTKVYHAVC